MRIAGVPEAWVPAREAVLAGLTAAVRALPARPDGGGFAAGVSPVPPPPESPPPAAEIRETEAVQVSLRFHEASQRWMVVFVEPTTGRVLETVPPEALLDTIGRIRAMVRVLLEQRP